MKYIYLLNRCTYNNNFQTYSQSHKDRLHVFRIFMNPYVWQRLKDVKMVLSRRGPKCMKVRWLKWFNEKLEVVEMVGLCIWSGSLNSFILCQSIDRVNLIHEVGEVGFRCSPKPLDSFNECKIFLFFKPGTLKKDKKLCNVETVASRLSI